MKREHPYVRASSVPFLHVIAAGSTAGFIQLGFYGFDVDQAVSDMKALVPLLACMRLVS